MSDDSSQVSLFAIWRERDGTYYVARPAQWTENAKNSPINNVQRVVALDYLTSHFSPIEKISKKLILAVDANISRFPSP